MVEAIGLFVEVAKLAIPFAVVFSLGQLVVDTFLRMAFGGKVVFK